MHEPNPPGGGRDGTLNDLYDVLSDERRRAVLAALAETTPPVHTHTLARQVCERERDPPEEDRVRVSLHHVHLPRLADSDLLEYDPERNEVVDVSEVAGALVTDEPL